MLALSVAGGVLPATTGIGGGPGIDASDRRAASGVPFAGARMLRGLLTAKEATGRPSSCEDADARMGIEALYRTPTDDEAGARAIGSTRICCAGWTSTRPNQVWAMDITYIPMARGFVYLAVVLDWFSRRVLSWRLSITMEAAFCVEALEEASPARQTGDLQHGSGQPVHGLEPSPAC